MLERPRVIAWFWLLLLVFVHNTERSISASNYLVGLGSYDITGPAADVNMMGYANSEPQGNRVVFVNLDACMASQLVTIRVLERLKSRYGNLYTEKNVAISGVHTHAGPGGYLQYVVYIVTSLGFVRQSFDALVDGIEQSIIRAHENLHPGSVYVNKGEILDAGVNRSPSAYLNNPVAERAMYKYDVDKEMTLLKFVDDQWGPVGSFNWFATHGTSMSRTNELISGDNKGTAACLMEDWFNQKSAARTFKENPRRVSNIVQDAQGNHHELLELAASFQSTSGKPVTKYLSISRRVRSSLRNADRPSFVSAFCQSNCGDVWGILHRYWATLASEKLIGKFDFRHTYLDFSKLEVTLPKQGGGSETVKTCPAAMGFAFAAGTTDGPGAFDFKQGDNTGNPFWKLVRNVLTTPSKEQTDCQQPKPILLDTGEMKLPYDGAPSILPVQILKIGQMVILSVPGGVVVDSTSLGVKFGDVKTDIPKNSTFKKGDKVTVVFWSACPRNDLMTEGTYALVELLQGQDMWVPVYDDDDICLRFIWSRPSKLSAQSHATIEWRIPQSAAPGIYRVSHFGASKNLFGSSSHFTGSSNAFVVK
ncbi:hypothetical protein L1987_21279 [Smallanthus sonchifolius]|uniref:Uncharacterized protein n=1 Tax=Smallanthus sonchifolius TaxID=185202 RepID=A0ACB9ITF7_9ASTR|nr:hypothetical protein L1987_21279 [Smallanthus sonchifolius]